ncbi:MAG: insulinase family protein [Bacteroidetes bacterium]|nr:insulinase family protein [Bacteroidota bacterium]
MFQNLNKTEMKKILIVFIALSPFFGSAQIDRSKQPTPGKAPVINIKDSEVFKTNNGITVILSENHKLPRVSFDLVMGSDPRMEKAGLSEMAGSLIMSGTTNRTKDQLDKEVDYIGASLSADNSSLTLSCLTKHMNKGLELMSDVLFNANFPDSEVERIRKQNQNNLTSTKSDASSMATNATVKINFPKHPYGEVMTEESLNSITREDILNYYKSNFTPQGSYLVIVGDITKEEATKYVDLYFGSWNGVEPYLAELGNGKSANGNQVYFVKKPGAVQSVVYITFPMNIKTGDKDQLALSVLNGILGGGGFGTRLFQNLREDKAFTYGCYSNINVTENGSWMSAGGNFRNAVTDSAITEILKEFEIITTELVKDEELSLTKSSMSGNFGRSLERPQTIARFALNIIKNKLDADYYKSYLQRLDGVTKEDVLSMAKKYFTSKNCNIIVVGNEEIVGKLTAFDSDGKIQFLDPFGNPVKDGKPADISKEQLFEKYISVVTQTRNAKELAKKLKKFKSYESKTELSNPQIPVPFILTDYWVSPNIEAQKIEGMGTVMQKSYSDGKSGYTFNQGKRTEMKAEEIAKKSKSSGVFPELNHTELNYTLTGIENIDGKEMYVVKQIEDEEESFIYYNKTNFLKEKIVSIRKLGEETSETTISYSDYKDVGGFLFPHSTSISFGSFLMTGKVTSIILNKKPDLSSFR